MAGTLKNLQCSLINSESSPFQIDNTNNLGFPMAPMTTAKYDDSSANIKIRTIVFIDSAAGTDASILTFSSNENENSLEIVINYKYNEETPTTFSCFYVEFDYSSETISNINTVITTLNDIDPKGSRGTYVSIPPTK